MYWLSLVIAGLFEVVWAVGLKYTEGFTKLNPSIITIIAMGVSFALLCYALRGIPLGTAYAVWTGIGASGALLYGLFYFNESRDPIRILCVLGIVACIIILKLTNK